MENVDEARMKLFCGKYKLMGNFPPPCDVLLQHANREASIWAINHSALQSRPTVTPESW